ncbi:MAG: hypothetical protein GW858_14140 [Sphingomonadales bacterium]|nr:hypothetical protein [Sphingomonadales bacterium]NCQ20659.1 hypothetical protein [Sphingomonadales bacterium]NCT04794.1 hypothetical protein [Sphingomonadales bacterium]
MLEGLWITRFVAPPPEPLGILSGVVVIETGRILGGDSGFLYLGAIGEKVGASWPVSVRIKRHDDRAASIFGDVDDYVLTGSIHHDAGAEHQFMLVLGRDGTQEILVSLTKAAELP